MEIECFIYAPVASNMYVVSEENSNDVVVIDPVVNDAAIEYLRSLQVERITVFLTHEDFDHTNGTPSLLDEFDCAIVCQSACASRIATTKNNRPILVLRVLMDKCKGKEEVKDFLSSYKPYSIKTDISFDDVLEMVWGKHLIRCTHTPGHTDGSSCIEIDNLDIFTGDTLLKNSDTILRFASSDSVAYEKNTVPFLNRIKDGVRVYPGHGGMFIIDRS